MRSFLINLLLASALALGVACSGASHDESAVAGAPSTGGASGSGPNTGGVSGNGGATAPRPCPDRAPEDGSPCESAGQTCGFGVALTDYLCTSELVWNERNYVPAVAGDAGAGAGGSAPDLPEQPEAVSCEAPQPCGQQGGQCMTTCCAGGGGGEGCAGCCTEAPCGMIQVTNCPRERCTLARDCGGEFVCAPQFDAVPECGAVTYYGQQVACCEGLSARCGARSLDGSCDPTAGGYWLGLGRVPLCMACGDGTCESAAENPCSCPEDCG